ncbi:MAG: DNA mismatch repair protein, partial [Chloroflexi bacterium]|nr:DNA mismatch repair protein [Chloroflexota bacterium]
FRVYAELFGLIGGQRFTAPALRRIQADLTAEGLRADQQMRRLSRIMAFADFRFFLLFFPINLVTLWNFHVLWFLERWQHTVRDHIRTWLAAQGEIEALAALAALRYDQPAWTFPEIVEDRPPLVEAQGLGHPLLPDAARVCNNVRIGPTGTFLLVTGSNMSGKSTLLRAIGTNIALGLAGGPVCAERLTLPPIVLGTSMRVQDSLEQGVSYFMAELQRLKTVVDRAEQVRQQPGWTLLFLLDEILHGTNTSERLIAARQIIRHLLSQGAIGAVSTHDLRLADAEGLVEAAELVHFTETFTRRPEGVAMRFDYRLRPGIATTTNALKLMEIVGLPVDTLVEQQSLE